MTGFRLAWQQPKLRSRLKDCKSLSLKTISPYSPRKWGGSTGKYADYRRLSKWRVGPKIKPRVYYAYQEKLAVRYVGEAPLVFSTMKPDLEKATRNDVKILMTDAVWLSVREVSELYPRSRKNTESPHDSLSETFCNLQSCRDAGSAAERCVLMMPSPAPLAC